MQPTQRELISHQHTQTQTSSHSPTIRRVLSRLCRQRTTQTAKLVLLSNF